MFSQMSLAALFGVVVGAIPLVLAGSFAVRPSERHLTLMRPLSSAAIFAAVCNLLLGSINALRALTRIEDVGPETVRLAAIFFAEAMVPALLGCACLTAAWLCVAVGMHRLP